MMMLRINNKIFKSIRTSLLNSGRFNNSSISNRFIRNFSSSSNRTADYYDDDDYYDLSTSDLKNVPIDKSKYPEAFYNQKWDLDANLEEESDEALGQKFMVEDVQLTEDKIEEGKEGESKEEKNGEFDLKQLEDLDMQAMLTELEELALDLSPPLLPYIKYEIYDLYKDDPKFWDIKRLSQTFKIHPGRIVALIRFVEIEKMEKAAGTYDEEMSELMNDVAGDFGFRFDDEEDGFEEDEHQKEYSSIYDNIDPSLGNPYGHNLNTLNRAYKGNLGSINRKSKNLNDKPDPIHEIPTQIPESYPEKPLYFRGPTFVVPRKKNVVFVDTSRHPITKKVNPDPMVLIQGIDGSLRTPSSTEKASIMQKVRPQRVKRDYLSVLNSPIKYKYQPKIKQTPKPVTEEKPIEESQ